MIISRDLGRIREGVFVLILKPKFVAFSLYRSRLSFLSRYLDVDSATTNEWPQSEQPCVSDGWILLERAHPQLKNSNFTSLTFRAPIHNPTSFFLFFFSPSCGIHFPKPRRNFLSLDTLTAIQAAHDVPPHHPPHCMLLGLG